MPLYGISARTGVHSARTRCEFGGSSDKNVAHERRLADAELTDDAHDRPRSPRTRH